VSHTFTTAEFGFSDVDGNLLAGIYVKSLPDSSDGKLLYANVAVSNDQFISAADIAAGMLSYAPGDNVRGNSGDTSFTFVVKDDGAAGGLNTNTESTPHTMTLDLSSTNYQDDATSSSPSSSTTTYALTGSGTGIHISLTDSSGSSDVVALDTANGGSTTFTDLQFFHSDNNMEINWTTASGSRSLSLLNEFNGGTSDRIEFFQFDSGGTFAGVSLGTGNYTLANGVSGTSGNDIIAGSNASETLSGGGANDLLFGNGGNDTLIGGAGNDLLVGGLGADTFKFSETGSANLDKILDFSNAEGDKIDLSGLLDGIAGVAANGSNLGNYVQLTQNGSDLSVKVDTSGTGNFSGTSHDVATLVGYGTSNADIVNMVFKNTDHTMSA
jgi:Ca2+-binding RTX toxin-like protein